MKPKRPRQRYDLVEVLWDDATEMDAGWEKEVGEVEPCYAISVGFLVSRGRKHLVLAQDIDGEGHHNGRGQIPRGMVKNIKVLRKRDSEPTAR